MRRVVLDTSILVAALRSRRGASHRVLELVALGRLRPLVSTALFLEYEDVLMRPETRIATKMDVAAVEGFLHALASAMDGVDVNFRWRPQLTDPKDELVLEAAVNGAAEALVTHNVRDFHAAAPRFGLRVLLPRELLKELE